ncbi:unnamed protein product [Lactuca virosa]|uniref:UvrD-like helicase ATP-binding domain-containing protein n=1 Tax=Lactuca virosa TaxID=75947 RepID=A0AAU9P064_9ASTR|nr:unnamed protein product [Lactuca virosa]
MELSSSYTVNVRQKCYIPGAMFGSFSFINIFSGKEVVDAENGMQNMIEVAVTLRILQLIYKECASSKHKISIAVLSPHPAQVQYLQQKVEMHYKNNELLKVKVRFFQDYEGAEDVTIISTVGADGDEFNELERSRQLNTNDYFKSERRCLWILGDERALLKGGSYWEPLILEAKARQCFFLADEQKELAKVVVEVKKDLHELDELLIGETSLFQNTTWKVFFSSKFITSFSNIESLETKKLVLLMLLKLSTGWRPKRSSTTASVSGSPYSDLMREFKVQGLHLLCTIDIVKDSHYVQALKVWDILPFHEITELIKRLEQIIKMYTREYINYCKARCVQKGSEFPLNWPATTEIVQYKFQNTNSCEEMFVDEGVENVKVRESLTLMKFYQFSHGVVNSMISGCDGGVLGLPIELTEQEKDVVSFNKSSFILGRSGTGKTTVLTTKLFRNEQLHHLASEGFHENMEINEEVIKQDVLHQLFVTLSPRLCHAVKQQVGEFNRLTCGSSSSKSSSGVTDDIDKMMLSEDIPDHFIHLPQNKYPLIITFHRFLLMLDGTVGRSYFERFPCVRQLLCGNNTSNSRLSVLEQYMRFKDVTYERFCSLYWHHFNNKLRKSFDTSTVYTEIMSVIKGGLMAGKAPNGILSREDYVALCDARTSILDAQKREMIYSIFVQYEKIKLEKENFDLADLVNDLHQRLEFEGYKGDYMDYVYIDEVQDLTMRQILLFKYVCTNVQEGYAFCGDTAQAIAKGIGFRFEDIRLLFFSHFLLGSEKGTMSRIFQLSQNFRTHTGVLNLAQSVIDLLFQFFPLFVDALRPETSRISGELPVLLETDTSDNAIKTIFGTNKVGSDQKVIGFGAEQVVLVWDEYLKEKVVNIVGKNALVLTIMESKGLEFQDVLLYDFFTTSSFSNEWRIIYEYMKEKDLNMSSTVMCSSFDMEKHVVLCSELKQLYVAITRTRQRLWISETTGFSQPIFDYWKKLSLVEVKHLNASFAEEMKIPSSKDEWKARGVKLYYENNFGMAKMCFMKAEDKDSERLAEAYQLRAIAEGIHTSEVERKKVFKEAAELFQSLGKHMLAAECFYEMEDYKTAAEEYEKVGAFAKCLSACSDGNLFEMGIRFIEQWGGCGVAEQEFLRKGALYYFGVKDLKRMMKFVSSFHSKDEMRKFLTKKRCFDELISLEVEWGNIQEAAKVLDKCALYYLGVKDLKSMMTFVRSFHSRDEMRIFLTKNRCFNELILLEIEWGNFEEAAKVSRLKINPKADLTRMVRVHKESSLLILWHVFMNSVVLQSTDEPFGQKDELLHEAVVIAKSDSNFFHQFVCKEASILSEGKNQEELLIKGLEFIDCYKKNSLAMSLKHVKTTHEVDKIEKDLLHLMRSFFKSVNRINELQILLEICGKFVEAANCGNEDNQSIEAALSRLWYVFFGSLWAHGNRAWPLKHFKQKNKLLHDANLYVDYCDPSSKDSALVRTEISILSSVDISLYDMWRYLSETPKEKSLMIHYLLSRRILDVYLGSDCSVNASIETWVDDVKLKHLESEFSNNVVSIEGLIYFWSYWKELIRELINQCSTWDHCGKDSKIYTDFISNYFGIRSYDGDEKGSYVVLNAEAHWVKNMNPVMRRNRHFHIIDACEFSSVASRYWCSELLYVSEKVLKLQSIHAYSTVKKFSIHQRMKILANYFKVTKSLQKCKLPNGWHRAGWIIDQSFKFFVDEFMINVFHINWNIAQSKEMISLRGNETFLSMLKEAININSKSPKDLTCGQLGRIAMIKLAYRMIDFNDDTKRKVRYCSSLNWRALFDKLKDDKSSSTNVDLAISLHNVLKETTFSAGWLRADDCMSPTCFLYLIERLLILSFCFRGHFFMTRSSCVEWLTYEERSVGSDVGHVISLDIMKDIPLSLVSMVMKMLNSRDDLLEWITKSKELYDILVLRLTVLLSMICVNSGEHYHHLLDSLGCPHLASILPSTFAEGLIKGVKEDCLVDALAVACEKIDNPLVIASFTKDSSMVPCGNAIFLNMVEQDFTREKLIKLLY